MNALEELLQDDLDRLVDRLAATTREGMLAGCAERRPDLLSRLEGAEARLSGVRQELLRGYAAWREALEACADLWALADVAAEPPPVEGLRAA
jgi:hypothetical protein